MQVLVAAAAAAAAVAAVAAAVAAATTAAAAAAACPECQSELSKPDPFSVPDGPLYNFRVSRSGDREIPSGSGAL